MFETLTKGFRAAKNRLAGLQELTEANLEEALRDIRVSLLEADVELNVTQGFLSRVKDKAVGEVVKTSVKHKERALKVTPADHFVRICQTELSSMMGPTEADLDYAAKGTPTGVMIVGLQGSGKTTTAAKLARLLEKKGRAPMLVAADVQRPAAVEQLQILGGQLGIPVFAQMEPGATPLTICERAMSEARRRRRDVVIFDTAGRLAIDEPLMQELEQIKSTVKPKNVLFVCDAMIGQNAVTTAREFHHRLGITGVILTKLDGDARGGAALSIKEVTGAPIRFVGVGEALDKLEEFRPDGIASRILGMGDIVSLMKDFEEVVDEKKAEEDAMRMLRGRFTLSDFLEQIRVLKKMGSLSDVMEKMPFFPDGMPDGMQVDDRELKKIEAIIASMTAEERADASLFDQEPGRVDRVAKGSARKPEEVKDILGRFSWMKQLMENIGQQAGLLAKIPGMKQLAMARRLRDAVKMQTGGNPAMSGIADTMLEAAVAGSGAGGGGAGPRRRGGSNFERQRRVKRKMQRKARKKSRRR